MVGTLEHEVMTDLEYVGLDAEDLCEGRELAEETLFPGEGAPWGLFFHGWNPLPTAASAKGGGDLLESLLHCAASMARGVPRRLGWSWNKKRNSLVPYFFFKQIDFGNEDINFFVRIKCNFNYEELRKIVV